MTPVARRRVAGMALLGTAGLFAGLHFWGTRRWTAAHDVLRARLDKAVMPEVVTYDATQITNLPAPVRRYFELVLTDGQAIVQSVGLTMTGTFNLTLDAPRWKDFTADQHITTHPPGFVWNAKISMFPALFVRVHDAYIAGEGILQPAILGLVPLGGVQDRGEVARGELMRWLAEAVWYPTSLLPREGMVWTAVDDTSAQVTMTEGPITLTMLFLFGTDGLVSGIQVEERGALVHGETVIMPWEGRFSDYRSVAGTLIPFHAEVAWVTPQGVRPYFRCDLMVPFDILITLPTHNGK